MLKNKIAQAKRWMNNHEDELIIAGWVGAMVTIYGGCFVVAVKMQNKQISADQAIADQLSRIGSRATQVLPGPDGTFWISQTA